jgi:glutathione peroxidase
MRKLLLVSSALAFFILSAFTFLQNKRMTLHDFTVTDINGQSYPLSRLKGKKVMVVNTASECGYTPQYKQLEELYKTYASKGLVVVGFPCNQFGGQEPGSNAEIKTFCSKNYGVTFPMMSKIDVKGPQQSPLYAWLTQKSQNQILDSEVKWNFQKYLIDENGNLVKMLPSGESPMGESVLSWLGH